MAQEASGLPYTTPNSTGTGAVYFDKTVEPLRLHLDNLDKLDNTNDFWKAWNLAQAGEAKKAKIAADITKDLATDYKGAMPEDIKTRFEPKRQEILSRYAKLMQSGVGVNNIQRNPEYQQIVADMNQLKGDVMRSAELGKLIVDASTEYTKDPKKYDETSVADIAKARLMNLDEREKYVSGLGGVLLKPKTADLEADLLESLKGFAPYVFDVKETPVTKNGQAFVEQIKVADPKKILGSSRAFVLNKAKDVDAKWNSMPVQAQQHYADAAAIESQLQGEEINPKEYFVYKWFRDKLGDQNTLTGGAFTPEREEGAKQKTEQDKFNALYDLINGVVEINPDVYVKAADGNPVRTEGKYYTNTKLSGLALGSRQAKVKDDKGNETAETVPDLIIATRIDPANPNIIEIRTDKDVIDDGGAGTKFGKKVTRDELLYQLAISNYNDPAAALNYLRKAAVKKKDVTGAGIISPAQTINTTSPITTNRTVVQSFPNAERTAQGTPIVTNETKKEEPKKEQPKNKIVAGKTMPLDATPKYSKKTGKLIGYELPDGTKYKF